MLDSIIPLISCFTTSFYNFFFIPILCLGILIIVFQLIWYLIRG